MSQLPVRLGRNAAREAKRLKEINKVKAAILWHEKKRKANQKMKDERRKGRDAVQQLNNFKQSRRNEIRRSLREVKEDWQLGSLRPNRKGARANEYGVMFDSSLQKPGAPAIVRQNRHDTRERKGRETKYPLYFNKQPFFHIEKGDRVIILQGKDKDKIGEVIQLRPDAEQVVVKDLNKAWIHNSMLNAESSAQSNKKSALELPYELEDVRLVVPFGVVEDGEKRYRDVIVEKVEMVQHTTGVDPWTGIDYGTEEFPKEHRTDPRTGLAIFNRYIAGTQHRIEWPWEFDEKEIKAEEQIPYDEVEKKKLWQKLTDVMKNPLSAIRNRGNDSEEKKKVTDGKVQMGPAEKLEDIQSEMEHKQKERRPESQKTFMPEPIEDVDSTRDIVIEESNVPYSLLVPPQPDTLAGELRDEIREMAGKRRKETWITKVEAKKRAKVTEEREIADAIFIERIPHSKVLSERDAAKENAEAWRAWAAEKMKTPKQVKWEMDHADKLWKEEHSPVVDETTLKEVLENYLATTGASLPQKTVMEDGEVVKTWARWADLRRMQKKQELKTGEKLR